MTTLIEDPIANGLADYAARLRSGQTTVAATVEAYAARIKTLDHRLQAWQHLDLDRALQTAKALDAMLAGGHDLGPLMGVPIGVKDIIAVEGMPTTNGSLHPSDHLTGSEGAIVARLKRAGCVVLGKTKTVEFALGATGVNEARGTPVNPWDDQRHRIPGGSSNGSAVATAAGMCGFALGTDTGGSVRIPACFNNLYGHKTTVGLWPTDGVFPLSPTLDSIGPLCHTADDAAIVHRVVTGQSVDAVQHLAGLKFGRPGQWYFDELDAEVSTAFEAAVQQLVANGVEIVEINLEESAERTKLFPQIVPPELLAALTPEGFASARDKMDSVSADRASFGLQVSAVDYTSAQRRLKELQAIAAERMAGLDGVLTPTCLMLPAAVEDLSDPQTAERALQSSHNTQPVNMFGLCAASLPITQFGASLPVGLQLVLPHGEDSRLLALSAAMEAVLGAGARPALSGFLA